MKNKVVFPETGLEILAKGLQQADARQLDMAAATRPLLLDGGGDGPFNQCPRVRVLLLMLLLQLLLGAWYLTPEALQGAGCPQNTSALCHDAGERGTMAHGRDHIVCIYPDRVTKIVRSCSAGSGGAA